MQQYTEQKYLIKDIWFGCHAHLSAVTGQLTLIHKNIQLCVTMLTDGKHARFGKSGRLVFFYLCKNHRQDKEIHVPREVLVHACIFCDLEEYT